MTTNDVVRALLDAGWRWERLGKGLKPVLTNTPRRRRYCQGCGVWVRPKNYYPTRSRCRECIWELNNLKC